MLLELFFDLSSYVRWTIGLFATLVLPFLITYSITTWQSSAALQSAGSRRRPPLVPYAIPGLENAITWIWDFDRFIKKNV
jgi:hypothetical protein